MVTFGQDGAVITGLAARRLLDGGQLHLRESDRETVSSGLRGVDSLLPFGGVRRGSLIELLTGGGEGAASPAEAAGAAALACAVACRLADGSRAARATTIVVVDRPGWFHPPAVLPWCAASSRLVVARPAHDDDEIWTIDQALACPDVAAVVAWPRTPAGATWDEPRTRRAPRRPAHSRWSIAMRRWQLSARSGGAVGLLVLPATVRRDPSWAEARIEVTPLGNGLLLERRLRLERVGGAWHGVGGRHEPPRQADIVLDLSRGCEGVSRVVPRRPLPREAVDGVQTCRAS